MNIKQVKGLLTGNIGELPCRENTEITRNGATGGMVLLKNEGVLPLKEKKIALFGAGSYGTLYCGTGSGYVFTPHPVTVAEGLRNAGMILTTERYLHRAEQNEQKINKKDKTLNFLDRKWSGKFIVCDAPTPTSEELKEADSADTAVYVIRRAAGEENDRKAVKGDYYLSDAEYNDLKILTDTFQNTVLIMNTCVIDLGFLNGFSGIKAVVYMGLAGMEGGNALAELLTGKRNFSGKLTDTFARKYSDYPASAIFGEAGNPQHPVYEEDIFVGYRYFDSFNIEPLYAFGYGMSYTDFTIECVDAMATWNTIDLKAAVHNTGTVSGREVVQCYVSAPAGRLIKPYQELMAYVKTAEIKPMESAEVTLSFPTAALASYDPETASFIMEKGDYVIRIGNQSRKTRVAATLHLNEDVVTKKVNDILKEDVRISTPVPPAYPKEEETGIVLQLDGKDHIAEDVRCEPEKEIETWIPEGKSYTSLVNANAYHLPWFRSEKITTVRNVPEATLFDVKNGNVTMEEFVASLPAEVLVRIVTGTLEETKYKIPDRTGKKIKKRSFPQSSGTTTGQYQAELGIPQALLFDGPAGIHIIGCAAAAFPSSLVMAQNWDTELMEETGKAYAREMQAYHVSVLLGPGMNIHRDPLCGRSFEYYAEDPLLSGKTAAAFVRGVQYSGKQGVSIKHFVANNQETCRTTGNSSVSQRALREIYLKGFEIAVKESHPAAVMTSYNRLNGIHTSSNVDLVDTLLRNEWGFDGYVMTDWGTISEKPCDLHAGNDLIMGGYSAEKILEAMKNTAPAFDEHGALLETEKSSHFGIVKTTEKKWGNFVPDANGKDHYTVGVKKDIEVSERVVEAQKKGEATVKRNADGTKEVTWIGTDRGAYLSLADLQHCAARVLRGIMNCAAMDDLEAAMKQERTK